MSEFEIDPRLIGMNVFDIHATLPLPEDHNAALQQAIDILFEREPSFVIEGSGRHDEEFSYVVVKRGVLQGFVFYPVDERQPDFETDALTTIQPSETNMAIISNINPNFRGYIDITSLPDESVLRK